MVPCNCKHFPIYSSIKQLPNLYASLCEEPRTLVHHNIHISTHKHLPLYAPTPPSPQYLSESFQHISPFSSLLRTRGFDQIKQMKTSQHILIKNSNKINTWIMIEWTIVSTQKTKCIDDDSNQNLPIHRPSYTLHTEIPQSINKTPSYNRYHNQYHASPSCPIGHSKINGTRTCPRFCGHGVFCDDVTGLYPESLVGYAPSGVGERWWRWVEGGCDARDIVGYLEYLLQFCAATSFGIILEHRTPTAWRMKHGWW